MANHKPKQGAQNQDNTLGDKEEEAPKLLHLVKSGNYLFHQGPLPWAFTFTLAFPEEKTYMRNWFMLVRK